MKRSILYTIIAFIVAFLDALYLEPKPIESLKHLGLVIATGIGYMLGSFIIAAIVLLLLMLIIKKIRSEFWNLVTLAMMGMVILFVLSSIFM